MSIQSANPSDTPSILLASRSPRRTALLTQAGIAHVAEHPGFDDAGLEPGGVGPASWVASLAYLKAWTKWNEARLRPDVPDVILGADTACVLDGRLIGTPRSSEEAREMIRSFTDREHDVVTGVAILDSRTQRRLVFADIATVRLGHLSEQAIAEYIAGRGWEGKAGAYNLEDRVAAGWPLECKGDPTTVMGLPMRTLLPRLREFARNGPGVAA